MIRVFIRAATQEEETALTSLLTEDDRFEIDSDSPDALLLSGGRIAPAGFDRVPTVILTDDRFEPADYRQSIRARLPSNATAAELLATLAAAAQGLVVLTEGQADTLFAHPPTPQSPPPLIEELTPRELQVLRDIAEGMANKEIAEHLHISEHTAKFHVASILGKLGASSRAEAVTQGIRTGLIPI